MSRFRAIALSATVFVSSIGVSRAEPIVAGPTILPGIAIQDVTLLPNTPFNPTSTPIVLDDLFGIGFITINRGAQVGSTIPIESLEGGLFHGSHPLLGSYVFGNVPPLTGADFSGVIENVVQDPSDPGFATGDPSSFLSGEFSFGGASFGFEILSGPAAGVKLFTDPDVPFRFAATFDGLPPSAGTVLRNSGPDVLNVLFNGQVVAQSSDRRILLTAVPEPPAFALFGAGVIGVCVSMRKRKVS